MYFFLSFFFSSRSFSVVKMSLFLLILAPVRGSRKWGGRSGEAVHITMMLQVVEQEEVQQVQIVALLGLVLPVDRRGR